MRPFFHPVKIRPKSPHHNVPQEPIPITPLFSASHSLTVLSNDPDATFPFCEKATGSHRTSLWPSNTAQRSAPHSVKWMSLLVAASHLNTVCISAIPLGSLVSRSDRYPSEKACTFPESSGGTKGRRLQCSAARRSSPSVSSRPYYSIKTLPDLGILCIPILFSRGYLVPSGTFTT
jgi:hypothetical protein